jgi:hypothetical protein
MNPEVCSTVVTAAAIASVKLAPEVGSVIKVRHDDDQV